MNLKKVLKEAKGSSVSALHLFKTYLSANSTELFVFLEGKDDQPFYMHHIRQRFSGRRIERIQCDGKGNLIKLVEQVQPLLANKWKAVFFVDKDVDDFISPSSAMPPQVYCTEHYSIENYLVSEQVAEIYWEDFFLLPRSDGRFIEFIEKFRERYNDFARSATIVMAWYIWHARQGRRVYINNISTTDFFSCDSVHSSSRKCNLLESLNSKCRIPASPAPFREILAVVRELRSRPHKSFIRGKYEVEFFVRFLNSFVELLIERNTKPAPSRSVSLTSHNAIQILSHAIPAPESLANFLETLRQCLAESN